MKKVIIIAAIIFLVLAGGLYLFIHLEFSGQLNYPVEEIVRIPSPDGQYEVIVQQLGSPAWPFGPVTARITLRDAKTGKRLRQFREEVMNDGGGLYPSQFSAEWKGSQVVITIDPAESPLIQHTIDLE